jgi:hypothetical protein
MNIHKALIFTIFCLTIFNSCEREDSEIEDCAGIVGGNNVCGCMEIEAMNYDSTATYDDGIWRENSPYRNNPWFWNADRAPSPIMWLYFDYYGQYLMTYKSTSDSYFNYFRGDPVGQNIYLLPDSNFEGGLGVFYSSSSSSFIVKITEPE